MILPPYTSPWETFLFEEQMLGFLLKFQYHKHPEGKEKVSLQTPLHSSGPLPSKHSMEHQWAHCGEGSLAPKHTGAARQSSNMGPSASNRAASRCASFLISAEHLCSINYMVCGWCLVRWGRGSSGCRWEECWLLPAWGFKGLTFICSGK